jgi:hypothetical protein
MLACQYRKLTASFGDFVLRNALVINVTPGMSANLHRIMEALPSIGDVLVIAVIAS